MAGDRIALDSGAASPAKRPAAADEEPLIHCVMRNGRRLTPSPSLDDIRARAKGELERLPQDLRRLDGSAIYPIEVGDDLVKLAAAVDSRVRRH
jgi:nicotinate phosphoribosyltransferase